MAGGAATGAAAATGVLAGGAAAATGVAVASSAFGLSSFALNMVVPYVVACVCDWVEESLE